MDNLLAVIVIIGIVVSGGSMIYQNYTLSVVKDKLMPAQCTNTTVKEVVYAENPSWQLNNFIQAPHTNMSFECPESFSCVEVTGNSMQPTFFTGNTLIKQAYGGQALNEGDIISYRSEGGGKRVHRIKAVYNQYYVVQGDNNLVNEQISPDNITDLVVGVIYN